ncbi:hypothetical protein COLO4_24578 [Corchorus olitorius]|uniref:TF-B3 domain-containing protein n=1 Tax=Corchorus olitorius TaxID=93759 RepID=A0A1R3I8Z4_9ROSI|nr:hypothetical protein COLO4_24578 [Corchorus olitorius]
MDSPKPFVALGLFFPANTTLQQEVSGEFGERMKSKNPKSLEPRKISCGLGFGLSEKRFFEEGECSTSSGQHEREIKNYQPQIVKPKVGEILDLSLKLSLGFDDSCSKKRPAPEKRVFSSCKNKKSKVSRSEDKTLTELRLGSRHYDDPWCIKKKLCESDLGGMSRLLLSSRDVETHVLPLLNGDKRAQIQTKDGLPVVVWDCDERTGHEMELRQWNKGKANVLVKNWVKEFVKRRQLKLGDEIGLYWDQIESRFSFSVLNRANRA